MGADLGRCSVSHLWRRACLTNSQGLVYMLCLTCGFTPLPTEYNWEICSKELLLLILPPPFVYLCLLISHLALRSCRAGQ